MSKAFTKEDTEVPERSVRIRTASGLPPGALNYMTADGARQLRQLIREKGERAEELEDVLDSATIVEPPDSPPEGVAFGARVTLKLSDGKTASCRVVGVDETELNKDYVSWISPSGKSLLASNLDDRVVVEIDGERVSGVIEKIEYSDR